jgi:hypothetical protein
MTPHKILPSSLAREFGLNCASEAEAHEKYFASRHHRRAENRTPINCYI